MEESQLREWENENSRIETTDCVTVDICWRQPHYGTIRSRIGFGVGIIIANLLHASPNNLWLALPYIDHNIHGKSVHFSVSRRRPNLRTLQCQKFNVFASKAIKLSLRVFRCDIVKCVDVTIIEKLWWHSERFPALALSVVSIWKAILYGVRKGYINSLAVPSVMSKLLSISRDCWKIGLRELM